MSQAPANLVREALATVGGEQPPFRLVAGDDGSWALCGEVDFACAPVLASALQATRSTPWVVDVALLDFIDVAGMRSIATVALEAGATLELRHASPQLRRLWTVAGFDRAAPAVRFTD